MAAPRITNNLPQFTRRVQDDGVRGMAQALVLGASEASVMTPINTSNLINSQFKSVRREGSAVIGAVGYTAAYAQPVHDHEHKQKFRRATAEKEFLKKGFENAAPNIHGVITGSIKTK